MPEHASATHPPVRLLPVTMPGPAIPAVGDWQGRGLCIGEDPDLFFPSHGDPGAQARGICAACPVRDDCLSYASDADELGIWGGLDQEERRNLKRRQRRKRPGAGGRTRQPAGAA